jgi:hypothetical protein
VRGLDEEWPVEQDHDQQQQDGGTEWLRKGGAHLATPSDQRGGMAGKTARPPSAPILVQAAGPRFDHHVRPRKQGHLISTRILRGTLGGQLVTRNFLEDRWVINAPTKGPVLERGEKVGSRDYSRPG